MAQDAKHGLETRIRDGGVEDNVKEKAMIEKHDNGIEVDTVGSVISRKNKKKKKKNTRKNQKTRKYVEKNKIKNQADIRRENRPDKKHEKRKTHKRSFRIRVGYVSANIKSKTTVYMAQDLMRFHDRSVHC